MSKKSKQAARNLALTSNPRTGKRAEYLQTHPNELAVESATVKKICEDIGEFRVMAKKWGSDGFVLVNKGRDIGIFINVLIDSLPGKNLTLDFWQQLEGLFFDQYGNPITREQLVWFANHAKRNPEPVTDVNVMLSYRKEILAQVNMVLEGERIGGKPEDVNFYNKFLQFLDEKKLLPLVSGLENDPHYGPIKDWPLERKQRAWLQFEPFLKRVEAIANELKPIEA